MKVICPVCEKVVSAYVPKGGDGSAYRPYRHGDCEGRFELVEEIYDERLLTPLAPDLPAECVKGNHLLVWHNREFKFCPDCGKPLT